MHDNLFIHCLPKIFGLFFLFEEIMSKISTKMHAQVLCEHLHLMLCGTHSIYKVVFFGQMVGVC